MFRHRSHFPTPLDAIAAVAVIIAFLVIVIAATGPERKIARAHDTQRTEDVRRITQAMLELKENNPERFADLEAEVEAHGTSMVMLGAGQDCSGSYGLCGDETLSDTCLDLSSYVDDLLPVAPHDPANPFSDQKSGYYLVFSESSVKVGACAPERIEEIRLEFKS